MPGLLRSVATLLLAVLPLAARAEGVDITVPDHYLVDAPGPSTRTLPVYRVWGRHLEGGRHSIVASASAVPAGQTLGQYVDATVAGLTAGGALDVVRSEAPPLCGAPSYQVTYARKAPSYQLTFVFRYTLAGGRLLIASYAPPIGTPADPTALAALDTLCSGVHQPGTPQGWSIEAPYPPNRSAWRASPESRSLVAQVVGPTQAGRDAADLYDAHGATVTSDRRDSCGATTIRRVTATLDDGRTQEFASGTLRGYDYVVAYVRPASAPADPGAIATLTSFCTETALR